MADLRAAANQEKSRARILMPRPIACPWQRFSAVLCLTKAAVVASKENNKCAQHRGEQGRTARGGEGESGEREDAPLAAHHPAIWIALMWKVLRSNMGTAVPSSQV